jgi:hypothetical protein
MGLTKFFPLICMLSKEMGLPSYIKTTLIPWPEASHSTINVFVTLGVVKTGVVHIASLSFLKDLVAYYFQENDSFFNNVVRGVSI